MIWIACECGEGIAFPEIVNGPAECPGCRRMLRVVGTACADTSAQPPGDHRLIVRTGPQRIGEQVVIRGDAPIEIGKLPEKHLSLPGTLVSRNHCRLVPTELGWNLEDQGSTNGVFINGARVKIQALRPGDLLRIGDYELEYAARSEAIEDDTLEIIEEETGDFGEYELADEPPPPPPKAPIPVLPLVDPFAVMQGGPRQCPSCQKTLPPTAKICVDCGIDLTTGRALLISSVVDEEDLRDQAAKVIRWISIIMPGIYPFKSEGFGPHKPYAVWAIAALTVLVTVAVWIGGVSNPQLEKNLALWAGRAPTADDIARGMVINQFTHWGDSQAFARKVGELKGKVPGPELLVAAYRELPPDQQFYGEFHFYQLITHGLLHAGIFHLAGNLLFLLVFGSRVNAVLGSVKTAILYPILMIVAGLAEMASVAGQAPLVSLGASGAIMGLAGMYFVLFPVHRVYIVAWIRLRLILGFKLLMKVFSLRGFWVVLFYLSFDILATVLKSKDGVAHWAHLGGFIGGMLVALALLLSRQVNAYGADLISALLGRHAWGLVGKPKDRQGTAMVPTESIATSLNYPA